MDLPAELIIPSADSDGARAARERVRAAMKIIEASVVGEEEDGAPVLLPPASEEELARRKLMPEGLKELYRLHNGQELRDRGELLPVGYGIFYSPSFRPDGDSLSFLALDTQDFSADPESGSYVGYLEYMEEASDEDSEEDLPTVERVLGNLPNYKSLGVTSFAEFMYPGKCNNFVVEHYMDIRSNELVHEVYFILEPSEDTYEEMAYVPFQCGAFSDGDCVKGRLRPSPFRFSYWLEAYANALVSEKTEKDIRNERLAAGWEGYSQFAGWFHCAPPQVTTAKNAVA